MPQCRVHHRVATTPDLLDRPPARIDRLVTDDVSHSGSFEPVHLVIRLRHKPVVGVVDFSRGHHQVAASVFGRAKGEVHRSRRRAQHGGKVRHRSKHASRPLGLGQTFPHRTRLQPRHRRLVQHDGELDQMTDQPQVTHSGHCQDDQSQPPTQPNHRNPPVTLAVHPDTRQQHHTQQAAQHDARRWQPAGSR